MTKKVRVVNFKIAKSFQASYIYIYITQHHDPINKTMNKKFINP